jgi:hypothetical protein
MDTFTAEWYPPRQTSVYLSSVTDSIVHANKIGQCEQRPPLSAILNKIKVNGQEEHDRQLLTPR